MGCTIYALVIIAYGLTLILFNASRQKVVNYKALLIGTPLALIFVYIFTVLFQERAYTGPMSPWTEYQFLFEPSHPPTRQIIIGIVYLMLPLIFFFRDIKQYCILALSFVLTIYVFWQGHHLTYHSTQYTLHPDQVRHINQYKQNAVIYIYDYISGSDAIMKDRGDYPPGWLTSSVFVRKFKTHADITDLINQVCARCPTITVSREWHSCFTGIYRLHSHQSSVWYPGGKPYERLKCITLRPEYNRHDRQ